jgi:hypothetical protein
LFVCADVNWYVQASSSWAHSLRRIQIAPGVRAVLGHDGVVPSQIYGAYPLDTASTARPSHLATITYCSLSSTPPVFVVTSSSLPETRARPRPHPVRPTRRQTPAHCRISTLTLRVSLLFSDPLTDSCALALPHAFAPLRLHTGTRPPTGVHSSRRPPTALCRNHNTLRPTACSRMMCAVPREFQSVARYRPSILSSSKPVASVQTQVPLVLQVA